VKAVTSKRKPEEAQAAFEAKPGQLMSVPDAKASGVIQAFGLVRVDGGYSFVRLKTQGDRVLESTFSEPDVVGETFNGFKKAVASCFVQNTPPEARYPGGDE
jgi:hypothetical protein